jgi:hypothetical protein
MIIQEINKWGKEKFAAIVTDNARNMVKSRRLVLQAFPHIIEVRYHPSVSLLMQCTVSAHNCQCMAACTNMMTFYESAGA